MFSPSCAFLPNVLHTSTCYQPWSSIPPFSYFTFYCPLNPFRLMKDKSVDTLDDGFMDREMPLEREYQRVSISGEEKCGVRSFSCTKCTEKPSFDFSMNLHAVKLPQQNKFQLHPMS